MAGIVLDFDGVLVDSMPRHAEAYRRALAPFGVSVPDRRVYLMEGARSESIIQELLRESGVAADAETVKRVSQEKQRIFRSLGPAPLYPGAEPLVRQLRNHVERLGLVTGTRRENLERLIPHLLPLFDSTIAQDGYTRDKPHPEPYLNSAAALGRPPATLAALENAIRGVQSAKAAGYGHVVGITTTMTADELRSAGADAVAADHAEAARHLLDWCSRSGA